MLKYLRLPFDCDAAVMRQEALALASEYWKLHYNQVNYEGGWSVLPLCSIKGSLTDIYAVHSTESTEHLKYLPTPLLDRCPYIASILNQLQFPKRAVRLMRLEAGAIIKEHSDLQLSYEEGEVRLHLPLQTNAEVEFYVHNERVIMNEGELWYLNLSLPHRVTNNGETDRIHLVIDGSANEWLTEQFARLDITIRKDAEELTPQYDEETRRKMVQELELIGTETALNLARTLH